MEDLWSPRIYGYCNSGDTYNKQLTNLTAVTINDVVSIGGSKNNDSWPELLVRGNGNAPTIEMRSDEDSVGSQSGYMAFALTHYSGTSNTQPIHEWRIIHGGNDKNQFIIRYHKPSGGVLIYLNQKYLIKVFMLVQVKVQQLDYYMCQQAVLSL